MVELLAPAGDLEKLKVAFLYGADACYVGGPILGLRANAKNFTFEDLKEGIEFAHSMGKKVYVTVNIVLHNKETDKVLDYLKELEKINVDAIIVSDPFIIDMAIKHTNLVVHLSTQQSCLNRKTVKYYKEHGVSRIVLARECSKEDIEDILKEGIEIETFIHGAMCAGISGRCVMSNVLTNRDANRGGCSQICRWDFDLLDENKKIIKGEKPFTFCSKDLSMVKHIKELIEMGITSFKIEGRMRSSYYIATVVSTYRKIIDNYYNKVTDFEYNRYVAILDNCANRDSTVQFYNNCYDSSCSYYNGRCEVSNQDFLGIVLNYDKKTHIATVEQRNYFKKGDIVEIFGPNKIIDYKVEDIYDENGLKIEVVRHPKQIVTLHIDDTIEEDFMIRIKK